ncbi:alpha-L-arabinofuranosidase C-terminal domain-containing protein [Paenibacillus abyssi]|uniref:non-reducing end alpha-L-arabinofuranosidase n=1 Tax=Paenibacillus abyssi TaxID=1340531 RepID=A0A917FNZ9_9BACL|nr:alpha-L-arabinofuranosidase C-terminal domain-containing protein [Paenibacillus abyssi]GGF93877.1 alpha-N-arabinofuranosidase [Paenibacillus abyssi]
MAKMELNAHREIGKRDKKIFGQFIEHFHRQIYGGIYEPGSALSDSRGFRKDVLDALKNIEVPVVRWPGGCFVSAYNWKDGVGKNRVPYFDKAWRVEESNEFGTDEFMEYCREIGAEPYICTNAGTGTPEEMSDWVEYCNLESEGKWAKLRIENGYKEPFKVKYWSIGNENYGHWEMGAKEIGEWGSFVRESAKMMKRVDPTIELLAASIPDLDWNIDLLRKAGKYLDWISIHDYWDKPGINNELSNYEYCMAKTVHIEPPIVRTKSILESLGYLGKIRIAFDEWNLRGWYHPHVDSKTEDCVTPRDKNDDNSTYTMADAVFSASVLNACHRHCDVVGMANFAPTVNTRGAVFTNPEGIVLRSTYHVFALYTQQLGDVVIDSWLGDNRSFTVGEGDAAVQVPTLDIVATKRTEDASLRTAIVNRHPEQPETIIVPVGGSYTQATLYSVVGDSKDAYNDVGINQVRTVRRPLAIEGQQLQFDVEPHSVNVLVLA